MSNLNNIVNVTITSAARGITRVGFGTPLVISQFAPSIFPELARKFDTGTAVTDMIALGFGSNDAAVVAVNAIASNTPKPKFVIVGRLVTNFEAEETFTILPIVAVGGEVFAFTVKSPDGTLTQISHTAGAADTQNDIATAVALLLTGISGYTANATLAVVEADSDNPNQQFQFGGIDTSLISYKNESGDTSLVADLTAIQDVNNEWYGLILADGQSAERIGVLAAYVETQEKIFIATTKDAGVLDPGSTTDVAFVSNAAQFFRTSIIFSGDITQQAAATWMGKNFPSDPGGITWAYKALAGIVFDTFTPAEIGALDAKKCNYYQSILGAPATNGGPSTGGTMASGEYIDVIRGRDKLVQRLRERVFLLFLNAPKVPYTDGGIALVTKEVDAQMLESIGDGYLSPDNLEGQDVPFIVTAPTAAEVSKADKLARLLPRVNFEAGLAGAIHATKINGTISV